MKNDVYGVASILSLVITMTLAALSWVYGNYEMPGKIVIVFLGATNCSLCFLCFGLIKRSDKTSQESSVLRPKLEEKARQLKESKDKTILLNEDFGKVSDKIHNIQDQLRNTIFDLVDVHNKCQSQEERKNFNTSKYEGENRLFYLFLINNVKTIFDILSDSECSVCIKILEQQQSSTDLSVKTLLRDSGSYRERDSSNTVIRNYSYEENTAFKNIMSYDIPQNYYVSDNLLSERVYENINENWNDYYNATLVCPIRLKLEEGEDNSSNIYTVIGFICIDNKKGGFDNRICIQLLASIADSIFNHFYLYHKVMELVTFDKTDV